MNTFSKTESNFFSSTGFFTCNYFQYLISNFPLYSVILNFYLYLLFVFYSSGSIFRFQLCDMIKCYRTLLIVSADKNIQVEALTILCSIYFSPLLSSILLSSILLSSPLFSSPLLYSPLLSSLRLCVFCVILYYILTVS